MGKIGKSVRGFMAKVTKISVVVTTLNEEVNVGGLMQALEKQTLLADEVVVVDAGSRDQTVAVIGEMKKRMRVKVKVAVGVNRSKGRNIGIRMAKNEWVAITDAGCFPDEDWLKHLAAGFSMQAQAVAGYYRVLAASRQEEIWGWFMAVDPQTYDANTYLPASRSLGLTKTAWFKVGGYPEDLDTCEDLILAAKLKALGSMVMKPEAIVWWKMPNSWIQFASMIFGYAKGDVIAGYKPHWMKLVTVFGRYGIFWLIPYSICLYPGWIWFKFRRQANYKDCLRLLVTQVIVDGASMLGALAGVWFRLRR